MKHRGIERTQQPQERCKRQRLDIWSNAGDKTALLKGWAVPIRLYEASTSQYTGEAHKNEKRRTSSRKRVKHSRQPRQHADKNRKKQRKKQDKSSTALNGTNRYGPLARNGQWVGAYPLELRVARQVGSLRVQLRAGFEGGQLSLRLGLFRSTPLHLF